MKTKIEVGFKSGKLTVVENTDQRKSGYMILKCKCDCGNTIFVDTRKLQRGTAVSCGCTPQIIPGTADLTGRRFGKLLCIEQTDVRKGGRVVWRCKCDCGNETMVSAGQLINGYTRSCGCLSDIARKNNLKLVEGTSVRILEKTA